ncbi:MAG: tetratricopeptide repeat protein [Acidobacteria bacterium]|nr:tetratricopeptide repeat protein [Acidobacteriota bacterium]
MDHHRLNIRRLTALGGRGALLALLLGLAGMGAPAAKAQGPLSEALDAYRRGDCAAAAPALEKILETQPKSVRMRKLLADCQTRLGRHEAARANYLAVLTLAPGDVEARRALEAPEEEEKPKPTAAPKPVVAAAPKAPQGEEAERLRAGGALEEAERLIQAGRLDEAERKLNDLIARQPRSVVARLRLAEICSGSERFHQAADLYGAIADQSGDKEFHRRAALNFSWAAEYTPAIDRFRAYLSSVPTDAEARLGLANALLWSGQPGEAAEEYQAYLAARPDDIDALLNQARALTESGRASEALESLAAVKRRRPDDAEVDFALAQATEKAGKLSEAVEAYRRVLAKNPDRKDAREAYDRLLEESTLQKGYRSVEEGRFKDAIVVFSDYLSHHPDDDAALLQTARVNAWAEQYPQAARRYRDYLQRNPSDPDALRELARVELALPDFPAAQQRFARLVEGPFGTVADREGLTQSYLWAGRTEEAREQAKRLLEIEPTNAVALEALEQAQTQSRDTLLEKARRLTAESNYAGALDAYNAFLEKYGSDRTIDLAVARVYAWDKQWGNATQAYENYVARYGDDETARLELARVREWSGQYEQAEEDYRALAQSSPEPNADALLGLAQVSAYRGDDKFDVVQKYRNVLEADPTNKVARERYEELGPEVSPSVGYNLYSFNNSDDFGLAMNSVRATLPFRGGLKASPFYRYDYFKQARQVGGTACGGTSPTAAGARALSDSICGADGITSAHVGGVELALQSGGVDFSAEVAAAQFDLGRNALQAQMQLYARTGERGRFGVSFSRRDAAYSTQTIAPVFAGVQADSLSVSYEQGLSNRWTASFLAGVTRYSQSLDGAFGSNFQRFGGARLNYKVTNSFSAGYYFRLTGFNEMTPIYFSPSTYGSGGGVWRWDRKISENVRFSWDAEIGYGRIDRPGLPRVNTVEVMMRPELLWRIQPDLALRTSYRYGRGSNSVFRTSAYQTDVLEFRLESSFLDRVGQRGRPSGLVIR